MKMLKQLNILILIKLNMYFIYNLNDSLIISNGNVFIKNKCIDTIM